MSKHNHWFINVDKRQNIMGETKLPDFPLRKPGRRYWKSSRRATLID